MRSSLWHFLRPALVLALLFTLMSSANAAESNWRLVWADEFDAATIDPDKWQFDLGTGLPLVGWGNNELQTYTNRPTNARIEEGMLVLEAHEEPYQGMAYTSARLKTAGRGDWRYGRFEIRARLPRGQGIWPAIWMMPTDAVYGGWPQSGEIDITELVGHESATVHGTVHFGPEWPNNRNLGGSFSLPEGEFADDFHLFALEWDPGELRWYVGGEHFQTITPADLAPERFPFDQRFHLILNVAVGGNWPGSPDDTTVFPQRMEVDYVRVYERVEDNTKDSTP